MSHNYNCTGQNGWARDRSARLGGGHRLRRAAAADTRRVSQPARAPPALSDTLPSSGILETGIKVIDLLCPFIRGDKTGLFSGAGVGKTVLKVVYG